MKYAIVCVDDDAFIVNILSFQLRKHIQNETTIVEVYTDPLKVEEAIEELHSFNIDIVFLIVDYQMPNLNGADLIKKLKLKFPELRCIMLSGQANEIVINQLKNDLLLEEFISKPWSEEKLMDIISPLLPK